MAFMGLAGVPCVSVSKNSDNSFTLSIDADDVVAACVGSHSLAIAMGDA